MVSSRRNPCRVDVPQCRSVSALRNVALERPMVAPFRCGPPTAGLARHSICGLRVWPALEHFRRAGPEAREMRLLLAVAALAVAPALAARADLVDNAPVGTLTTIGGEQWKVTTAVSESDTKRAALVSEANAKNSAAATAHSSWVTSEAGAKTSARQASQASQAATIRCVPCAHYI